MDQAGELRTMKSGRANLKTLPPKCNGNIRVISVTSGKGGVGKTNITANLAYLLSKRGKKILLLDADTGLANIDIILGITPKYNLSHVLSGKKTLAESVVQGPGGIKILPASSGIRGMTELSKGQKFTLIEELDSLDENFDYMLIDTAAGITENVLYFNMVAGEIIVVVTPEPTSLTDAYALIKILYRDYSIRRFMLVVNMVMDSDEAIAVARRLNNATNHFLDLPISYLGHILKDRNISEAVRQQRLIAETQPDSKASKGMSDIITELCRRSPPNYDDGTIKFFNRFRR